MYYDVFLISDVESETRKGEWHEIAKKELEDWYKHRAEQLEKTKVNNRLVDMWINLAFCLITELVDNVSQ